MAKGPATGLAALRRFEGRADAAIEALPISALPARALLTGIHYFLYSVEHAGLFDRPTHPGVAETAARRLGYLLPILVNCAGEPFGESAQDALEGFMEADPDGDGLAQLLTYAHFSEFMPEAHKNYYQVAVTGNGFRLVHRDAEFAEAQARDILLSELALVFPLPVEKRLEPVLRKIVNALPAVDWDVLGPLLRRKMDKLVLGMAEPHLIAPAGMERVFGFGYLEFYRIRAAVLAYAEFALEVSMILGATSNRDNRGGGISSEALEWVSVNHEATWFTNLIATLAAASPAQVDRFLGFFSIDFRTSPATHNGGDGLFPPFARFEKSYVFSPMLVLSFLHLRNAVFAFSLMDEDSFSKHVSHELEPVLVRQARELLRRSRPWVIEGGVVYDGGEIDLIVAGPTGPVLLVEAKGPLPPQGARLTERLAERIREGVAQINRFRNLPPAQQEAIVSRAVGRPVRQADLRFGVLARSCFGAVEVYDPASEIARITLPLLSLALGEMRGAGEDADIDTLLLRLQAVELRYLVEAEHHWEEGAITLIGEQLRMPLLKYDQKLVDAVRALSWEYSMIEDPDGQREA